MMKTHSKYVFYSTKELPDTYLKLILFLFDKYNFLFCIKDAEQSIRWIIPQKDNWNHLSELKDGRGRVVEWQLVDGKTYLSKNYKILSSKYTLLFVSSSIRMPAIHPLLKNS